MSYESFARECYAKPMGKLTLMYWEEEREKNDNLFEKKEQGLMDQIRTIWRNNKFTDIEMEEIRIEVLALDEDGRYAGDVEDQMSKIEAVELHDYEDAQIKRIDITVPVERIPNQQEGESAEGTNDEQRIEWIAITEG